MNVASIKPHQISSALLDVLVAVPNSQQRHCQLTLKLEGGYLSCRIKFGACITLGWHIEKGQWVVLHHDATERFVTQVVDVELVGTRSAFAEAFGETPFVSNNALVEKILDIVCDFSKRLNLFYEPEVTLW